MVVIEVSHGDITIALTGWDGFWAMRSQIKVPISHVTSAHVDPISIARSRSRGMIRLGGTYVPGAITAGQYRAGDKWLFWLVHKASEVLVIDLQDEHFSHLVLETPNARELAIAIEGRVRRRAAVV